VSTARRERISVAANGRDIKQERNTTAKQQSSESQASKKVVYIAIAANVAIAICKYIAAGFTGSSAMLAEAFHSTADSGNELLLLLGMKRAARPADNLHPFGHGKVLYFYSLLVAVYIFGMGGVLAMYQGITRLRRPENFSHTGWNYAVLAFATVFELYSWRVSYREILARKDPHESTWQEIIGSKDPTVFTVFLEDTAALIGMALAFLGIFLSHLLHKPFIDAAASILIGVLLSVIAVFLGRESGALLVGERTNRSRVQRIRDIIRSDPSVDKMGDVLTMQLGPDEVLLNATVKFRRGMDVRQIESSVDRIQESIHREDPTVENIFIEADPLDGRARKHKRPRQ
jgi:cation diffusion facilitator family transporter